MSAKQAHEASSTASRAMVPIGAGGLGTTRDFGCTLHRKTLRRKGKIKNKQFDRITPQPTCIIKLKPLVQEDQERQEEDKEQHRNDKE